MSSPPDPRTFEALIAEEWPGALRRPDVMAILEPCREHTQYLLDEFDEAEQSWRDYCCCIWGWPGYDGSIPAGTADLVRSTLGLQIMRRVE